MTVRAKFRVLDIKHHYVDPRSDHSMTEIRLLPVFADDGPNKTWAKATPAGELKMTITNPPAADFFELGRSYFLDFTPAD